MINEAVKWNLAVACSTRKQRDKLRVILRRLAFDATEKNDGVRVPQADALMTALCKVLSKAEG